MVVEQIIYEVREGLTIYNLQGVGWGGGETSNKTRKLLWSKILQLSRKKAHQYQLTQAVP